MLQGLAFFIKNISGRRSGYTAKFHNHLAKTIVHHGKRQCFLSGVIKHLGGRIVRHSDCNHLKTFGLVSVVGID